MEHGSTPAHRPSADRSPGAAGDNEALDPAAREVARIILEAEQRPGFPSGAAEPVDRRWFLWLRRRLHR